MPLPSVVQMTSIEFDQEISESDRLRHLAVLAQPCAFANGGPCLTPTSSNAGLARKTGVSVIFAGAVGVLGAAGL